MKIKEEKDKNNFYNFYHPIVRKYIYTIFKKKKIHQSNVFFHSKVNNIVQDVFISYFKNYEKIRNDEKFILYKQTTLLYKITENKIFDLMREKNTVKGKAIHITFNEKLNLIDEEENILDKISNTEYNNIKLNLIKKILQKNIKYSNLIFDAYLNEMKYSEISKKYNIPIGTVKSCLHRSIGNLRKILSNDKNFQDLISSI